MRFKDFMTEILAGPGGGPEQNPEDLVALGKEIARKGAGAYATFDNMPTSRRSPTANYGDHRLKKYMSAKK